MKTEAEALRYVRLDILYKIRANDYKRLTKPFKRYDPEVVDREIARKIRTNELRLAKYSRSVRTMKGHES